VLPAVDMFLFKSLIASSFLMCSLQRTYSQRLVITVAQSTQKILLLAQGQGEEPQLEFSSSTLDMGSILPYSGGKVAEVIVRNPCPFPIEFYSLDFDKQYLEEEEVSLIGSKWDCFLDIQYIFIYLYLNISVNKSSSVNSRECRLIGPLHAVCKHSHY